MKHTIQGRDLGGWTGFKLGSGVTIESAIIRGKEVLVTTRTPLDAGARPGEVRFPIGADVDVFGPGPDTTGRAEAFEAGLHRGHTAANWQEAQTSLPTPDPHDEAELVAPAIELRAVWIDGFIEGWERRYRGQYADGTPMDEDSEGTGYACKRCGGPSPVGVGFKLATPTTITNISECACGHSRSESR